MKREKCVDCITKPMTLKKVFAILGSVVSVAFACGIGYSGYNQLRESDKQQTKLLEKMAHNLNTLNINLFKQGQIDNLDIVSINDEPKNMCLSEVIYPEDKDKKTRTAIKLSINKKDFKD